jgi:sugar phosphate isomerase/epimerase
MQNRRNFIKQICLATGGLTLVSSLPSWASFLPAPANGFKISLAQWSLHKAYFSRRLDPLNFPVLAKKEFGIEAVEYVNQFFPDKAKDMDWLRQLKLRCNDNAVKSVIIMIDNEGHLAGKEAGLRLKAVENHYKWLEAAKFLGCPGIRVNLHGDLKDSEDQWVKASVDGLGRLTEFAAKMDMNVIVENHGGHSCKGKLLAEVMQQVNSPHCGILPDFGNFCIKREKGDMWESPCIEEYDKYLGVQEMLPYAKGISAKSFDFDTLGNELKTDFYRMFKMIKESSYRGYVGIEYEGTKLSEEDGIRATKKLLDKCLV